MVTATVVATAGMNVRLRLNPTDMESNMTTKKKRGRKKKTEQSMYGSKEIPRQCKHCGSDNREVYSTNTPTAFLRVRYCKCKDCGKNWTSTERIK